jgi:hypothetical protein
MTGAACQVDPHRGEGFNGESRVAFKANGRSDADVDASCQYVLYHLIRVGNGEPDPQAWMSADDTGNGLGDGNLASKCPGANRDRSRFQSGKKLNLPAQISVVSEHGLAAFEQNAAKHRGYRALARPIEQRNPEGAFQRSNPSRETRLRNTHLLGRPREVAVAPERNREADEAEIIHDTKSVSQPLACDIGHIAAAVEHSALSSTPSRPTLSA